jgi:hypothetical protein
MCGTRSVVPNLWSPPRRGLTARPAPCPSRGSPCPKEAAVAKPRRTHVPIHIIGESPQGDHFLRLWQAALGTDTLRYRALERLKDGSHLFLLDAPAAWAVLVDRREEARGPDWLHRYAILFEPSWSPVTWQVELTAYRWDPWLQADREGEPRSPAPPGDRRPPGRRRQPPGPAHPADPSFRPARAPGGGRPPRRHRPGPCQARPSGRRRHRPRSRSVRPGRRRLASLARGRAARGPPAREGRGPRCRRPCRG